MAGNCSTEAERKGTLRRRGEVGKLRRDRAESDRGAKGARPADRDIGV